MVPAKEALARLKQGNKRYLSGGHTLSAHDLKKLRDDLAKGQSPIAIILSCSDSRVPTQYVFDQDLGDLFVIRVAGNVAERSQVASIEYAVEQLGTRLIVVMGHTQCGVVQAALKDLSDSDFTLSSLMQSVVSQVEEAVCDDPAFLAAQTHEEKCRIATHANVRRSVERLSVFSESLRDLIASGKVLCVGAEYSVETGVVSWL